MIIIFNPPLDHIFSIKNKFVKTAVFLDVLINSIN